MKNIKIKKWQKYPEKKVLLLFNYVPIFGWIYFVFDYIPGVPILECDFMGLDYFKMIMKDANVIRALKNTFIFAGISIILTPLPMIFAILLNEIKSGPVRKFVQTFTTLPNFISWVMVYSIAFSMFNSTGMMNTLLTNMGVITEPVLFLNQSGPGVWLTQWLWLTWKNLGWASIMYIAAISGIDNEMYEAAKVDGATRMKMIWYITIPSLLPTFFVLLMINIANFLNNGMEQYYVFQNAFNKEYIQVLDLYVYNTAMGAGSYSVSVAISMLKSLVSLVLLFFANGTSKLIRGESFL